MKMNEDVQKKLLKSSIARHRYSFALFEIFIGGILVYLAFAKFQGVYQTSVAAFASALLGAGFLALHNAISFSDEIREIFRESNLKQTLRDAFSQADNLREDGIRLGVVRILASIDEVRRQSIEELVGNANIVYILSTTAFTTTHFNAFLQTKPNTQFRFIFVDLPEGEGEQLEEALSIIHNVPIRGHIEQAKKKLGSMNTHPNVSYKTIQFVPPFSAILAIGETEAGESWGRLQIDYYLLRTPPDSRLWLIVEGPGSILFDRYCTLIEHIWHNPNEYDMRTANISP
jgi:hypothetical protein